MAELSFSLSYRYPRKLFQTFYSLKLRILKFLNVSKVKSLYGVYLNSNFEDKTFEYYIRGKYGIFYWNHISNINKAFIYLDIGANQGLYSLCAAANKNCNAIYAFEPVSKTYSLLKRNIEMNGYHEKCNLIQKAVSNKSGIAKIKTDEVHSGVASIVVEQTNTYDSNVEEITTIDGKDLDGLIQNDNNLPVVVKIDVEGFEKSVILGLINSDTIKHISEIYYEVDERWVDHSELEHLLKSVGFINFKKSGSNQSHYDILATR